MKYDNFAKAYLSMLTKSTQILSEDMLMEDRIEWLKNNVKSINSSHDTFAAHRDPRSIIDFLSTNADPSKKKVYTQHLIKMYNAGNFRQEDAPRVKDAIHNFDKYKHKLPEDSRDISKYSRVSDIEAAVEPHLGTAATKAEEKQQLKDNKDIPGKHELKYDDEHISIYHLKDKETSQKMYGSRTAAIPGVYPTEWCTAWSGNRPCQYDSYNQEGKIHVIHRKSDGAVFQFHAVNNQFMDKNDNPISPNDLKSIEPSLHKAFKKSRNFLDLS